MKFVDFRLVATINQVKFNTKIWQDIGIFLIATQFYLIYEILITTN